MAKRGRIYRRTVKDPTTGERVEVGPFWIQYWLGGKDVRETTRSTNRRVAEKLLTRRMAGKDSGTLDSSDLKRCTFEDLRTRVEADYVKKQNRSKERMLDAFQNLASMFAGWDARRITEDRLNEYFMMRLEQGKARATVVYELRCLRRGFKLAKVPVPSFECGPLNNERKDFIEPGQLEAILNLLPAYLRGPVRMGALTSWRVRSEILPLKWSDVDVTAQIIRLDGSHSKNKKPRYFPYGAFRDLANLIATQRAEADQVQRERQMIVPWVFFRKTKKKVLPIKSYRSGWESARARAGFPEKVVHDTRRTGVRSFRHAGLPESVSMKLSGHLTRSIFLRYDIVDDKDLQAGVAQLGKFHEQATLRDTYGAVEPLPKAEGGGTNG